MNGCAAIRMSMKMNVGALVTTNIRQNPTARNTFVNLSQIIKTNGIITIIHFETIVSLTKPHFIGHFIRGQI